MRMNGNVKFGGFMAFIGGAIVSDGIDGLEKNVWVGIMIIALGLLVDFAGINLINRGIEETIRMRDLETAAKIRKSL